MQDCLDNLRALCEAATPGTWFFSDYSVQTANYGLIADIGPASVGQDSAFISIARTTMPLLIDLVECQDWKVECNSIPVPFFDGRMSAQGWQEFVQIRSAAIAAVEAAKTKLEEAVCK